MSLPVFHLAVLFTVLTVAIIDAQSLPYVPKDIITIDCGSLGNGTGFDLRRWNGDINSTIFPLQGQNKASIIISPTVEPLIEEDPVPYGTARLSRSKFTYKIPVTSPGPKFIRLYFYSAQYQNFSSFKAFFSVKTGHYTLLSNFSVFLTAEALGRNDLVKEFYVPVEKSVLNITFTPVSSVSEAFAFVNGIEVVSTPADLYFWEPDGLELILVGQQSRYALKNDTAFETVYRINIGGCAVSPVGDTGMFRKWDQDDNYLTVPGYSLLPVNTSANLSFSAIPSYIAPASVYRTARSTGNAAAVLVKSYNLTWEFPVDSGFSYMLRLHFCEIQLEITKTGDRVFRIYIANETAEERFDVVWESGGQYKPYFRDYVVLTVLKEGRKKINVSVALHVIENPSLSGYLEAILNGVEIFKLNHSDGNLAGPNSDSSAHQTTHVQPPLTQSKNNQTLVIKIFSSVITAIVILSIGLLVFQRWKIVIKNSSSTTWCGYGIILSNRSKLKENTSVSSLPSDLCRCFSLAEIKAATKNFDDAFLIGVGGFGNVYKGYIEGGDVAVAVKRLKAQSSQGAHEFKTEIEMLSRLRHLNLVSLIGYCNEDPEMILVYEYMTRGTLSEHLYNTDNPPLSWKQRLQICIGAASGLHYLHTGVKHMIIHRDVKTTNILLDERLVAKVSDFGLSKLGPTTLSKNHVSTMVKGSFGYFDPEYFKRQQLTEKSDVYSFGVVLCEVLSGKPPILRAEDKKQMNLVQWVRSCYQDGAIDQIVDPYLMDKIAPECLKKYREIMMSCIMDNGAERPSMKEVVRELEFAMQLQNNADENIRLGGEPSQMNSDGTVRYYFSWEDSSGAVFSEIKDLQGR